MAQKHNFITFSGMDGTGKTTLAMELGAYVKTQKKPVHVIHGHQYATAQKSMSMGAEDVRRHRLIFRFLTPFAYIDNIYTYLSRYRPVFQNQTLVCDRYFYDKIVRMLFYGILTKAMAVIYLKAVPRPDYSFFLDVDEQTAYDRKAEYTLEEYKQFRELYLWVATELNAPVIKTTSTIEKTLKQITAYINAI